MDGTPNIWGQADMFVSGCNLQFAVPWCFIKTMLLACPLQCKELGADVGFLDGLSWAISIKTSLVKCGCQCAQVMRSALATTSIMIVWTSRMLTGSPADPMSTQGDLRKIDLEKGSEKCNDWDEVPVPFEMWTTWSYTLQVMDGPVVHFIHLYLHIHRFRRNSCVLGCTCGCNHGHLLCDTFPVNANIKRYPQNMTGSDWSTVMMIEISWEDLQKGSSIMDGG